MRNNNITKMVQVAILMAIIVVLQLLSYVIKIGTFNLSLVLIPIVVGAVLFGKGTGAFLGGVFSVVVVICCATGTDVGGAILWNANPWLTGAICMVKGIAAGFVAGLIADAFRNSNKPFIGTLLAAVAAPVVNTGLFLLGLSACFYDILVAWAGGQEVLYYIVFGLVGVNFLIEFSLNLILSTTIASIVTAIKKVGR